MSELEWRPIAGFLQYEVSNDGRVRRCAPTWKGLTYSIGRHLTHTLTNGYHYVSLQRDGTTGKYGLRRYAVHRLVAEAFIGPAPSLTHHVAHNDGAKSHNGVANLRWATPLENSADRSDRGAR